MVAVTLPDVDSSYLTHVLLELLRTPSPTGFTHEATAYVGRELDKLSVAWDLTPKGALVWTLTGAGGEARAVASHIDTLGAMVKLIKPNGRLELSALGSYDWATIEGAECKLHTAHRTFSGTVVNIKQSSHVYGPELRDLKRKADTLELRLDVETQSRLQTEALGVSVGDFVSFDSLALLTDTGFVKGRHLDNKAAVAVSLAVTKAVTEGDYALGGDLHFFVSNYEEVGHGASAGIPEPISELLCIDMAAIGEGQTSSEFGVTLCVKDSSGPYDYHMNERLRALARANKIPLNVDIYPYYGSDASAAWRAGGSYRAALIGPGVDASHAFERTHQKALSATAKLLLAYALEGRLEPEMGVRREESLSV